jgi:hypothetical protein
MPRQPLSRKRAWIYYIDKVTNIIQTQTATGVSMLNQSIEKLKPGLLLFMWL